MTSRPLGRRCGFTLIEVLVAIVILATGLVALLGTSGLVTRLIGDGARMGRAAAVASERFELIRSQGCGSSTSGVGQRDEFRVAWDVEPTESPTIWRVTVQVTWPTPRGELRSSIAGTCRS